MIVFQLICENGHEFEGWFQSTHAYEDQANAGAIECPFCMSNNVTKGISSPNVATSGAISEQSTGQEQRMQVFRNQLAEMSVKFRDHVEQNFDYVGAEFPDEARRIHYGEAEDRGIYGEATPTETEELLDEGIAVMPLPGRDKKETN